MISFKYMEMRVFISRAAAFFIAYPILLSIPFFLGYKLYPWLYSLMGRHWWLAPSGLLAAMAMFSPLIYGCIRLKMENKLLAEQKAYQEFLLKAADDMASRFNFNLDELSKYTVNILKKTVKIKFSAIFLTDKDSPVYRLCAYSNSGDFAFKDVKFVYSHKFIAFLKQKQKPLFYEEIPAALRGEVAELAQADLIIPILMKDDLFGFILLGKKLNHKPYAGGDINVFQILSRQIALAIKASSAIRESLLFKEPQELNAQGQHLSKMSALSTIASGVGHNLNNRFNTILTLINIYNLKYSKAQQNIDSLSVDELKKRYSELKQLLEQIKGEAQRGFDIAAILGQSARQPVKPQAFYLEEAVKLAFGLLKAKKDFQRVNLIEGYPREGPKLYASLSHMQDVLFNIGDNAYDALLEKERLIKKGKLNQPGFSPTITIKASFSEDRATIAIHDNGMGIKPEALSKIGKPFYSTKAAYKQGMGLGVWMAKRHMQMNRGKLFIDSTYTQGTTVTLTLPLAKKAG